MDDPRRPEISDRGPNADTYVVVPLYNEAAVIGDVLRELRLSFSNVVCVDDGSSDGSAEAARAAGAFVLQHPINLGAGAALQTGFDFVLRVWPAGYVVTFDADGQHRPPDAVRMVERARQGDVDVVLGSRFLDRRTRMGILKRIVLKVATWGTNLATGVRLTDAHNGLRVLDVAVLDRLRLYQDRMAHASEIISEIGRHQLRWCEMPVEILYTDYSKRKGQSLWNAVNILVELTSK